MTHKARILSIETLGDGLLAVRARCCGDASTDSVLTLHEVHRADEEVDADIDAHLARIETLHAARDHAKAHIERLCPKSQ